MIDGMKDVSRNGVDTFNQLFKQRISTIYLFVLNIRFLLFRNK